MVVNGTSSRHLALVGRFPQGVEWNRAWDRVGVWRNGAWDGWGGWGMAWSRRSGASRLARLAHLATHHHLPGNTGDLAICHRTRNPCLLQCFLS